MDSSVRLEGQPETPDQINRNGVLNWESVTPRSFESMSIRLHGRVFDGRDRADADLCAIVSEATPRVKRAGRASRNQHGCSARPS
jgi:hypothetical protein